MRKSPRATLASWVLSKLPKCIHNLIKFFYNIAEKNGCFLINCKNSCNARKTITNASIGSLQTRHNRL